MYVYEQETITNMDVTELIGARPFAGSKEYAEYIALGWKKTAGLAETAPAAADKENNGDAVPESENLVCVRMSSSVMATSGGNGAVEGLINPAT